jgi:predicted patatin/cPLA2 family phospholipase
VVSSPTEIGGRARAAILLPCLLALGCGIGSRTGVLPPALQSELVDPNVVQANYLSEISEKPINVLAISGGGVYGAFDVGILKGWSDSGARPAFDVVTGISTGAFIAPFAFVGPKYDDFLKESYLNLTADQIYRRKSFVTGIFSQSIASSKPLKRKIDAAVTPELLAEVAQAHKQGRRLYAGTTNLDTRKLVIWDLGAIAASGKAEALDLFRTIVLASGSVPAFYPPVFIEIDVDGKKYKEMHVDGGASCSVFVRPFMLTAARNTADQRFRSNLYVIASGKLYADQGTVAPNVVDITTNAMTSLLYAGTRSDVNNIYGLARANKMNFGLASVPVELPISGDCLSVDPKEMKALYDCGYRSGLSQKWLDKPPDATLNTEDLPRSGVEFQIKN